MLKISCILLIVVISIVSASAQKISDVTLFWIADQGDAGRYAEVRFDKPLATVPDGAYIHIWSEPSNRELNVSSASSQVGNPALLIVHWTTATLPSNTDTTAKVSFDDLTFAGTPPVTASGLSQSGPYYTRGNVQQFIDQRNKEFEDALAIAKTSEERNIFAGLSVASPTNGDTAGDADIHLNGWLSQRLFTSLTLNKSSSNGADPKQFKASMTYRKVIPFLFSPSDGGYASTASIIANRNLGAALHRRLLGVLIDGTGQFEGDASSFSVTNAVFNLPVQIASRTMAFGQLGRNGYWQFRLQPAGVEVGHNLGSNNPHLSQYDILRYAYGGTLGLIYDSHNPSVVPTRISLDLEAAGRYLLDKEAVWDSSAMKASSVLAGLKPWYQADLKLFLLENEKGRVGFRITFIRGGLPPVFNQTRAFRYGLIYETADDKSSQGKPK